MGYIGFHASIAGGPANAIDEAVQKGAEAIQIFTANQRTWEVKDPSAEDVKAFLDKRAKSGIKKVVAHDSYLINLASVQPENLKKSRAAFLKELKRSAALKIDAVIFHPGSFTGGTRAAGVKNIIRSVNAAASACGKNTPLILLETTAGSGNSIGGKFEDLAEILKGLKKSIKAGVCFDTAHVFEAGYDLKNDYEGVFREFNRVVGVKRIGAFHVNDSKTEFESHSDRHEHIGRGKIGADFFRKLMNDRRFSAVPMIIETPAEGGMDVKNIKLLKTMRKTGKGKK